MANKNISEATYESILKEASQKRSVVFNFSKTYPAYITLAVFLVISFFVWKFFGDKVQTDRQNTFDKAVNSIMTRFENKYKSNLQVLNSIAGLYDEREEVVRDYFMLYSSVPTETYPSIISLIYAPKVMGGEKKDEFIFNAQRQGMYDYSIKPEGKRDFYYPVYYVEPFRKNGFMAGRDFAVDKIVDPVIKKARDSNEVVATPVFKVREAGPKTFSVEEWKRDSLFTPGGEFDGFDEYRVTKKIEVDLKETEGFYIVAPVYKKDSARANVKERRKNFNGVVILETDAPKFFEMALGAGLPSDTTVIFKVYEDKGGQQQVIYKSDNYDAAGNYTPYIKNTEDLKIADKVLKVEFATVPNFGDDFQSSLPILSFILSLILSFVFFAFILSVSTSRARAMDLAESMTRSQRRIVDTSDDIIAVTDLAGKWMTMNPASTNIFGHEPNELVGQSIDALLFEESDKEKYQKVIANAGNEVTERTDLRMKDKNGHMKWLDWSFTVSKADGLVYCIGRDVTLEKLAEEESMLRAKQIELAEQFTKEASEFKSFFMTKLGHQMRNSLTGILGYLELLARRVYDSDDERDSYIDLARESSEELFTFAEDMGDIATETAVDISTIQVEKIIQESAAGATQKLPKGNSLAVNITEESKKSTTVGDRNLLGRAFVQVFTALARGVDNCEIQVSATENPHEGATEIQLLTNSNSIVSDMIGVYKNNKYNLIEALRDDKNDIILSLAKAASNIRLMNGTMQVETFGPDEGNVVQITMPLNKHQE